MSRLSMRLSVEANISVKIPEVEVIALGGRKYAGRQLPTTITVRTEEQEVFLKLLLPDTRHCFTYSSFDML